MTARNYHALQFAGQFMDYELGVNAMKPVIFAVEDDPSLQELYLYSLEHEFECSCFDNSDTLFEALDALSVLDKNPKIAKNLPDLILLDVMLPGDNGFSILSRLKSDRRYNDIPVIMVSAKGEEISKVKGLNMGASDYIAKPFGVLELVARIKANLRKTVQSKNSAEIIKYKNITVDRSKHKISVNGVRLNLTLKEHKLLLLLSENAEKVQEREIIFAEVWGNDFVGETRTLDIHVKELRRKLAEVNCKASIQTIRGVGYMMI
ncbi:MAG: response regulator transcription factor [Oscillospiraceae bacterium]|nr:response regulator transcription factor [Oscillospiraceae bacterium]